VAAAAVTALPSAVALIGAGVHRIHCSDGTDALTIYLPLDEGRKLVPASPRPWLLKARLDDFDYYGEFVVDDGAWNRIVWGTVDDDFLTDLGKAPLRLGGLIRLRDNDEREWSFSVRHLVRV
jgi:hypothetical protein